MPLRLLALLLTTLSAGLSPAVAQAAEVTGDSGKGLTVTSDDGQFSMNVRGRIQLRESLTTPPPGDGAREVTTIGRVYTARVWLNGHTLSEDIGYTFQLAVAPNDYRDGTISPIFDATLDLKHNPNASLRVGQIFVPFDRARTIREFSLQLADRPRPVSELTLDRDVGAYLYSDALGGSMVAYRLGVFAGGGGNAIAEKAPGGLAVARVELRPLGPVDDDSEGDLNRRETPGLALGVAAAYNLNTNRARSTTSTTYTLGTADYLHLAGDVVFKWRGVAVMGEAVLRDAQEESWTVTDDAGVAATEYARSGWGWLVQPSVMITPKVELAGRTSRLYAFEGTDPKYVTETETLGNELAAGVNYYLNKHRFKVQGGWTARFGEDFSQAQHTGQVLVDVMF